MGFLMVDNSSESRRQVERVAAGDQAALAELLKQYRPRLRRMVQLRLDRRLQGRVDPSDVLQEAFFEISRRAADTASQAELPFFLWLRMMTGQKLLEIHRRHLGTQLRDADREISLCESYPEVNSHLLASQLLGKLTSASQAAMRAERQSQLEATLNSLEPLDREILTLRHFEELSNAEVAQVLGLSKSAASNRYIRALVRLKERLSDQSGIM
jgi:RNA polymerase sigma-70 factor (ECF subfamily)